MTEQTKPHAELAAKLLDAVNWFSPDFKSDAALIALLKEAAAALSQPAGEPVFTTVAAWIRKDALPPALPEGMVVVKREFLTGIEFASNGYCPACAGWEVEKGRGCKPKVHTKDCWLAAAAKEE